MAGSCFVCGNPVAPFGFGWPGLHSEKPKGKRGYLRACCDHREDGERRREAAIAASFGRSADASDRRLTTKEKGSKE